MGRATLEPGTNHHRRGAASRRSARAWIAALSLAYGVASGAQAGQDFPAERDLASIRAWLAREVRIPEARLAILTAASAFTVLDGVSGPERVAVVRQEILDPVSAAMLGGRSARVHLQVDCAVGAVKVAAVDIYSERALQGGFHTVSEASWRSADPDAELDDLSPLLCRPRSTDGSASSAARAIPGRRPPAAGGRFVQIGAFSSQATAEAAFSSLRKALPEETRPLGLTAEPIADRRLSRALVGPFADEPSARRFCAKAASRGLPCFVR